MSDLGELPPADLMEALMRDPVKRGLILQLLNQEKDGFEAYKRREMAKSKHVTPVKRINRLHCESPTALQRRRALEMLHRDTTSESSSSEVSEAATEVQGPQLPFEELLKGVRAYVEVRRNDMDRSEGIKTVMRLMGATIRDKFTNDVTHVVFKDGSFTTYQKAKLMKVHLVSVLWLDAVKRKNARVPEKNYPAFGSKVSDENVSVLCSQLQKDYEDIIKDEKRRSVSILSQTSKTVDKNRRRTMMTPKTSMSSYKTAQKSSNFFTDEDREIDAIISQRKPASPDITSDDSDCGVINGETSKRPKNYDLLSTSSIISNDSSKNNSPKQKKNDNSTSSSISLLSRNVTVKNKRQTIRVVSDMVITPNIETTEERARISDKKVLKDSTLQSTMSLDSDRTKSGLQDISSDTKSKRNSKTKDKENSSVTTVKTTMSSLRLSDSFEKNENLNQSPKASSSSDRRVSRHKDNSNIINDSRRSRTSSVSSQISEQPKRVAPHDSRSRERSVSIRRSVFKTRKKTNSSIDDTSSSESEEDLQKAQKTKTTKNKTIAAPLNDKKNRRTVSSDSETESRLGTPKKKKTDSEASSIEKTNSKSLKRMSSSRSGSILRSESRTNRTTNREPQPSPVSEDDAEITQGTKTMKNKRNLRASSITKPSSDKKNKGTALDSETENLNKFQTPKKKRTESEDSSTEKTTSKGRKQMTGLRSDSSKKTSSQPSSESEEDADIPQKTKAIKNNRNRRASSVKTKATKGKKNSTASSDSETEDLNKSSTPKKKRTESEASSTKKSNANGLKRLSPSKPDSSTKKMRKLYNPDDVSCLVTPVDEDQEREEYQRLKSQKTTDDLFINPNNVIIPLLQSKNKSRVPDRNDDIEFDTQKTTKPKSKNKTKTPPKRDSSADEQRELLELLTKKTNEDDDVRHSRRLSLSQIKPKYCFTSSSEASSVSSLPITPLKRRSTLDFQPLSQTQLKRKLKLDPKRKSSIVCTKMHRQEVVNFESIVRDLGWFFVEDKVTNKTTHLVAAEAKRTINMLRAITRGCWILRHEWLLESKEEGKWLPEEDYELTEFSPAVQECRLQRQAFGPTYTIDVFKEVGFIYLAKDTTPKTAELKELIVTCKGRVTSVHRNASVVVGEFITGVDGNCVTEKWVLDSITFNKLKSFKNYLIRPVSARSPEV